MDDKKYAVLLTDSQEVKVMECNSEMEIFDIGRNAIGCEWIELVEPEPLARNGMLLMINEEAKLKGFSFINCIANHLYNSEHHGNLIVGDAVIVKTAEDSLELLSETEAKQIAFAMEQTRDIAIEKMSKTFGLRPSFKKTSERVKAPHRQTGDNRIQER